MKNVNLYFGYVLIGVAIFSSCAKDPLKNLSDADSRIYITNYDSTTNFNTFKTYSISDSVAVVNNGVFKKAFADEAEAAIIQAVKDNMEQRGFLLVNKDNAPDIAVNVTRIVSIQTGIISYPSYWGYYNNYWDPYYWGYGGYDYYFPYSSYAVYQISEGALSIDMIDLKDAGSNKTIKGVWNGLIRGEGIFSASNAASQVKALFDQSPYITTIN